MRDIGYRIVLASASPRRRELLSGLDLPFEVRLVEGIAEDYPAGLPAEEIPQWISRQKAAAYTVAAGEMLLTADTVVVLDGEVLGKPADEAEARAMLRKLSGRSHRVITGVTLRTARQSHTFAVTTRVTFRPLGEDEIAYYVERYRPLDKAGAYGIQEWIGHVGVCGLEGSFFNVMGLPVQRIYEEMRRMAAGGE